MKKNSGKNSGKSKAAPASASNKKAETPAKAPRPETRPVVKETETKAPETTPFESAAASPLSKETPAISKTGKMPATKDASIAPIAKPNSKPGKRPVRSADAPKVNVKIPSLLLEGDLPPSPSASGSGTRYALAPVPVAARPPSAGGELPEAYGTGRVFLAARDPHWLYVSWDFTTGQQNQFNTQSRDGHLIVRVYSGREKNAAGPEVHVHPESKNWFIHVPYAETLYQVEVGFYGKSGSWQTAAVSQNTFTPPDAPSTDVSAKFATIPPEVTFQQVVEVVQQFVTVSKNEPLLEAVAQANDAQREGAKKSSTPIESREPDLPRTSITRIGPSDELQISKSSGIRREPLPISISSGSDWSEAQTHALTKLIHIDSFRRVWLGSMEITELVRLQLQEEMASIAVAEAKRAIRGEKSPEGSFEISVSSPAGGEFQKPGKFWFKINAELIVYGATEPDATVRIADRPIKLRPDGTFSFRFSLPDGRYALPAVAVSSNGEEGREARLEFSRATEYRGHVEPHAQDTTLRPPQGENVG